MNDIQFQEAYQAIQVKDLSRISAAKDQIHQAAQLVSAVSRHLLAHHPWDIFGNLEYRPDLGMFLGWSVPGRFELRAGLDLDTLSLKLTDPMGGPYRDFPLSGRTFEEAFQWLKQEIADFGIDSEKLKADLPYDIPQYPQADGAPFPLDDPEAFAEVRRGFDNARHWLEYVSKKHALWQPIKAWPHHFDISSRRRMDNGAWHMGVGYSPGGDHNYPEPYYHLTCYPSDGVDKENLPELTKGLRWHKEKWLGVALLWSDLKDEKPAEQARMALEMAGSGMEALEKAKP